MLDAEPTAEVMIAVQTSESSALGMLLQNHYNTNMNWLRDYSSLSQELTITANPVLTQCVNITIIQDGAVENSAEFFFQLQWQFQQ